MKKSIKNSPANNEAKTPGSGKKLVQARLPFKILTSPAPVETPVKHQQQQKQEQKHHEEKDGRKRKLSSETAVDLPASKILCSSKIKKNLLKDDAILISDDDSVDKDSVDKDSEDKDLILSSSDDEEKVSSIKTPKNVKNSDNLKNSSESSTSVTPFRIKLPISSKRRRKISEKLEKAGKKNSDHLTASEDENVEKRFKVYSEEARDGKDATENDSIIAIDDNEASLSDEICLQVTQSESSVFDSKNKEETLQQSADKAARSELFSYFKISEGFKVPDIKNKSDTVEEKNKEGICKGKDDGIEKEKNVGVNGKGVDGAVKSKTESREVDKEIKNVSSTANTEEKASTDENEIEEIDSKNDTDSDTDEDNKSHTPNRNPGSNQKLRNKTVTPKQFQKLKEREEKQKQKEEERLQKQKEKEEKEQLRKKEKEEKEEQRRKEKEEREEQKRKEKEEKEKKRLAEIEAKNEERRQKEEDKRKKEELKEEERRKREEERKRKEQEKEEVENKKKKAAEAFTKFFVQKQQKSSTKDPTDEDQSSADSDKFKNPAFMPFQVRAHMKLAPLFRKTLNSPKKEQVDKFLNEQLTVEEQDLYLYCLKTGKICPGKDSKTWLPDDDVSSDCLVIEDELEDGGQTIVEVNKPVQKHRAKYLYFHENQRPPYYGTWRKKSRSIKPRRPFALDAIFFDYEIDSDDEWEEEEPGESLHGSDDEKESEDDYEVDNEFFVPHGHLSDEELQNEDENADENTPEIQKAKLKILQQQFAQEMKKKTEKIKPRLVGPLWQDENGNEPELCHEKIWQSLNKRAMIFTVSPSMMEPQKIEIENTSPNHQQEKKVIKKAQLSEEQIKDLIRLVHGNKHNKQFMIKEFQAFLTKQQQAVESSSPIVEYLKSTIREQIDKIAEWKVLDAENKLKKKKRLCWLVFADALKEYGMEELNDNNNTWEYILQPKNHSTTAPSSTDDSKNTEINPTSNSGREGGVETNELSSTSHTKQKKKKKKNNLLMITKFTTVITKEINKVQNEGKKIAATNSVDVEIVEIDKIDKNIHSCPEGVKCENDPPELQHKEKKLPPAATAAVVKKRVPLLISVPRGQNIPESTKNALISDFLKKTHDTISNNDPPPPAVLTSLVSAIESVQPMEIETVVID